MCPGGSQQHYSVDNEPVWQPQSQYSSGSAVRGHPSVNGTRYVDDGYGGDLDSSGHFDLEPAFTQQQVNGESFLVVIKRHDDSQKTLYFAAVPSYFLFFLLSVLDS